jgi:large subunit ribosomal protein L29
MAKESFADLDDAGVVAKLAERQYELVRARFALSMGRLEDTASLSGIRKGIARVKTELRRREIAAGLATDDLVRTHKLHAWRPDAAAEEAAPAGGLLSGVVDKLGN